jgi:1-acyl-sn-glycerol-3-phosphate acyltransferase
MPSTPEHNPWTRAPYPLRRAYEYAVYWSVLTLFGGGALLLSPIAFVLYFVLPRDLGRRLGRRSLSALFRFFHWYCTRWGLLHIDLNEIDALADQSGLVIAPNHISLFDVVCITSRLSNVVCIAKSSILHNPLYGGFARLARFIPNDHPASMVKLATAELQAGANLLVFPEGTRVVEPPIMPFRGGFALIAKRSGAPIHTLFITASSGATGKRWPLLKAPACPFRYRVQLGERFEVPSDSDTKEFIGMLEAHFRDNLPPDPRNANLS